MNWSAKHILAGFVALYGAMGIASAQFSINFTFDSALTADQQGAFNNAAATWESLISGYQPGINFTDIEITVDTNATAGPSNVDQILFPGGTAVARGSRIFADTTATSLDAASLERFATREIGNALGIGSLYQLNNLLDATETGYIGPAGLAVYQAEFDPTATFIPVELIQTGSLPGSNDVFAWDVIDDSTAILNGLGQDLRDEFFVSNFDPTNPNAFISQTTIASLEDLGFQLSTVSAIPEPSTALLVLFSASSLLLRRRRS